MSQPVRLDQLTVAIVIMAMFGFIGFRRGILRELAASPAILLAPVLSPWLGRALVPWVNRFYKLALFARYGGLTSDDLQAIMEQVKKVGPLIKTEADVALLGTICFLVIIALGYILGQLVVKGPGDTLAKWTGAVIGGINGLLLVLVVVPKLWSAQYAVIVVPTAGVLQFFQAQTTIVAVVAFIVLAAFGLQLAQRK